MKKLFVIAIALAMVASFVPQARAEDSAVLGLTVTFDLDEPLRIWSEPEGAFMVKETETLMFKVIAEDLDTVNVNLEPLELPEGARWLIDEVQPISAKRREGTFVWTPKIGQAQREPYIARFLAKNYEGEKAELAVEITVLEAVISIELNQTQWNLEGVGLNEKRTNESPIDGGVDVYPPNAIHHVTNTGNVPVLIDMGYLAYEGCDAGLEPGVNQFATVLCEDGYVGGKSIPPYGHILLTELLKPDLRKQVPLVYYSPTELTGDVKGMSAKYKLRACPADLGPQPIPMPIDFEQDLEAVE